MRPVGLIGYPVEHSLSPAMQNAAFRALNLDYHYTLLPTSPEQLPGRIRDCIAQDFAGWNITVPHKQAMLPFLDEISEEARAVGACNTVRVEDGRQAGFQHRHSRLPVWVSRGRWHRARLKGSHIGCRRGSSRRGIRAQPGGSPPSNPIPQAGAGGSFGCVSPLPECCDRKRPAGSAHTGHVPRRCNPAGELHTRRDVARHREQSPSGRHMLTPRPPCLRPRLQAETHSPPARSNRDRMPYPGRPGNADPSRSRSLQNMDRRRSTRRGHEGGM